MLLLLLSLKIDATLANRVCRLRSCNSKSCVVVDKNMAPSSQNFLQKVFNTISLLKNEELWLSTDDDLTEERLQLVASFSETQFAPQLKLECVANAKNSKLSTALREKGIQLTSQFIIIYIKSIISKVTFIQIITHLPMKIDR